MAHFFCKAAPLIESHKPGPHSSGPVCRFAVSVLLNVCFLCALIALMRRFGLRCAPWRPAPLGLQSKPCAASQPGKLSVSYPRAGSLHHLICACAFGFGRSVLGKQHTICQGLYFFHVGVFYGMPAVVFAIFLPGFYVLLPICFSPWLPGSILN